MASMKFEKGSPEWKMFMDLWALCQKFWIPSDIHDEKYWNELVEAGDKFTKENNTNLARAFLMAFLGEKDKEARGKN